MNHPTAKRRSAAPDLPGFERILPEIQSLIEASRQHVVSTANLTLVWLYWNVGRVITQDIQKNQRRADYGEQLLQNLGRLLRAEYGDGFSLRNLRDMRRFFECFEIWQTPSAESEGGITLSMVSGEFPADSIRQTPSAESGDRISIDLSRHCHLGWSHYRILLSLEAGLKRRFYFDQSAQQRWSVRELSRQIDRALFERVALSHDTRALVRLEKASGPVETVRYEDAFKDAYPNCRPRACWKTGSSSTAACWRKRAKAER